MIESEDGDFSSPVHSSSYKQSNEYTRDYPMKKKLHRPDDPISSHPAYSPEIKATPSRRVITTTTIVTDPDGKKIGKLLDVCEDNREGKGNIVRGLTWKEPSNTEELFQLIEEGNLLRAHSPTDANKLSSRSHAVLQIAVHKRPLDDSSAEWKIGKLSLIDLAGSERASVTRNRGERLIEGANINRSLLALGNCINALCTHGNRAHIPYRDSKLTRLLKDSLGGSCRTVMIANISPSSLSIEDTHNTLKYANRAKNIKVSLPPELSFTYSTALPTAKEVKEIVKENVKEPVKETVRAREKVDSPKARRIPRKNSTGSSAPPAPVVVHKVKEEHPAPVIHKVREVPPAPVIIHPVAKDDEIHQLFEKCNCEADEKYFGELRELFKNYFYKLKEVKFKFYKIKEREKELNYHIFSAQLQMGLLTNQTFAYNNQNNNFQNNNNNDQMQEKINHLNSLSKEKDTHQFELNEIKQKRQKISIKMKSHYQQIKESQGHLKQLQLSIQSQSTLISLRFENFKKELSIRYYDLENFELRLSAHLKETQNYFQLMKEKEMENSIVFLSDLSHQLYQLVQSTNPKLIDNQLTLQFHKSTQLSSNLMGNFNQSPIRPTDLRFNQILRSPQFFCTSPLSQVPKAAKSRLANIPPPSQLKSKPKSPIHSETDQKPQSTSSSSSSTSTTTFRRKVPSSSSNSTVKSNSNGNLSNNSRNNSQTDRKIKSTPKVTNNNNNNQNKQTTNNKVLRTSSPVSRRNKITSSTNNNNSHTVKVSQTSVNQSKKTTKSAKPYIKSTQYNLSSIDKMINDKDDSNDSFDLNALDDIDILDQNQLGVISDSPLSSPISKTSTLSFYSPLLSPSSLKLPGENINNNSTEIDDINDKFISNSPIFGDNQTNDENLFTTSSSEFDFEVKLMGDDVESVNHFYDNPSAKEKEQIEEEDQDEEDANKETDTDTDTDEEIMQRVSSQEIVTAKTTRKFVDEDHFDDEDEIEEEVQTKKVVRTEKVQMKAKARNSSGNENVENSSNISPKHKRKIDQNITQSTGNRTTRTSRIPSRTNSKGSVSKKPTDTSSRKYNLRSQNV